MTVCFGPVDSQCFFLCKGIHLFLLSCVCVCVCVCCVCVCCVNIMRVLCLDNLPM
ncbi:rCG26883 [Rattus norvegicus]|uniref:RCG26883 n=1 Tax=Rattus norvegicus TaxID=10116 RepID=A6HQ33_RAT|nr:rCG26883 [Rattus norvegicus]